MSTPPAPTASRKRKAPIDDNGEPVIITKKKKAGPRVTKKKMTTAPTRTAPKKPIPAKKLSTSSSATRQPSVEDVFDERDHPPSLSPHNPQHILEPVDSDEEDDDPAPPAIDVEYDEDEDEDEEDNPEDEEEDDDAELGLFSSSACKKV